MRTPTRRSRCTAGGWQRRPPDRAPAAAGRLPGAERAQGCKRVRCVSSPCAPALAHAWGVGLASHTGGEGPGARLPHRRCIHRRGPRRAPWAMSLTPRSTHALDGSCASAACGGHRAMGAARLRVLPGGVGRARCAASGGRAIGRSTAGCRQRGLHCGLLASLLARAGRGWLRSDGQCWPSQRGEKGVCAAT